MAFDRKTGKETKHTYTYNAYGEVATQDGTAFMYDDAAGQALLPSGSVKATS